MATQVSARARDGLNALQPAPPWVRGATPIGDAEFLLEMVTAHQPTDMIELGVAAGISSAFILYALDTLPDVEGRRQLRSCDVHPACYLDSGFCSVDELCYM